jgi:hypothetical protein
MKTLSQRNGFTDAFRPYKDGDMVRINYHDGDHVPYNKRRSAFEDSILRVEFTKNLARGWVEISVDETTSHESGRVQTRTIHFGLEKHDVAKLIDFLKNAK